MAFICCIFRPAFGCCSLQTLVEIYNIYYTNTVRFLKSVTEMVTEYCKNDKKLFYLHYGTNQAYSKVGK